MNYFKDIIIGITGGLITFCITSTLTETWDIQLPLWIWSIVFVGVFGLGYAIYCLFLWYYSTYGYEPTEIRTKKLYQK